jgi:hypothetical protein
MTWADTACHRAELITALAERSPRSGTREATNTPLRTSAKLRGWGSCAGGAVGRAVDAQSGEVVDGGVCGGGGTGGELLEQPGGDGAELLRDARVAAAVGAGRCAKSFPQVIRGAKRPGPGAVRCLVRQRCWSARRTPK